MQKIHLILIFLLVTACGLFGSPPKRPQTQVDNLPDILLFSTSECSSSCWQGLRPGETNLIEVTRLLSNKPFAILRTDLIENDSSMIYASHDSDYGITVIMLEDTLYRIELGSTELGLTAGETIKVLGEPNFISIGYDTGGEVFVIDPELTLYYPNQGYVFHLQGSDGLTAQLKQANELEICISEDAIINGVEIIESGSITDILEYLEFPRRRSTVALDQLSGWTGFSCIIVPYP